MLETIATLLQLEPRPELPGHAFTVAAALVTGALLGEAARRLMGWPRIIGYSAVGFVLAWMGLGLGDGGLHGATRLVVDMALALLLFELGSRVNLRWWRANPVLPLTAIGESLLSLLAVAWVLQALGMARDTALVCAALTTCASAAVVGRVSSELQSAGQVTDRMIVLTACNTLFAVLASKLLIGWLHHDQAGDWVRAISQPLWVLGGSVLLAAVLARLVAGVTRGLDLRDENATLLLLGLVALALLTAQLLSLSPLLVPLLAGLLLRNTTQRPWVWPRHFGTAGGVLVLMLFVIVGSAWTAQAVLSGGLVALALVATRFAAKTAVVMGLARWSGLHWRQGMGLSLTLVPVSGVSLVLLDDLQRSHAAYAAGIAPVVLSVIVLTELVGPLAVQWGLRFAGELGPATGAPAATKAAALRPTEAA